MSRYIDADAIPNIYTATHQEIVLALEDAPSIDIVRCRECKYWNMVSNGCMRNPSVEGWQDDDFCSYGSRSEKPNNCETCKFEIYCPEMCEGCCEWDSHYEPKDEPQTDWHYDEQDATWYPYKHEDEPQQKSCATCKHALGNWDGESNNCGRCCGADRRFYEPKDEPQTERSSE